MVYPSSFVPDSVRPFGLPEEGAQGEVRQAADADSGRKPSVSPIVELGIDGLIDAVEIGRGGFAVVYKAFQPALKRFVAVKVFGGDLVVTGPALKTFQDEIEAISRVGGRSNILAVYDAGTSPLSGRPYMVMGFMARGSLERDRPLPWGEVVEIGIKLAKALQVAHDAHVLHLDVKPDNVLISDDGEPLLADFGTARLTDETRRTRSRPPFTPLYVAPEVLAGKRPTAAADIYALATTLFTLLAGRPAFGRAVSDPAFDPAGDDSLWNILRRVGEDPPPDLLRPRQVPELVCRLIERAMAKSPSGRPSSAAAFATELQTARDQAVPKLQAVVDDQAVHEQAPVQPRSQERSQVFDGRTTKEIIEDAERRPSAWWLLLVGFLLFNLVSFYLYPDHSGSVSNHSAAVAVAGDGSVYIADVAMSRIRLVTLTGITTTVAGNGKVGFSGDSGLATAAELNLGDPAALAVGRDGSVYVADESNNRVRRVSPTGIITTVAGNGKNGFAGDGGLATAAELSGPAGVAVTGDGSIYIADIGNDRIRRVSPTGMITTAAGNGVQGFAGNDRPATAAELYLLAPAGVAVGADGSVYIADVGNSRVRRVTPAGIITTVAGNGTAGFAGDNGPAIAAELDPEALAVASDGSVYIADHGNNRVRRVAPAGIITTVAGNGKNGFAGDGGLATAAELSGPAGVAVAGDGSIYIADEGNSRVRRATPAGIITTLAGPL